MVNEKLHADDTIFIHEHFVLTLKSTGYRVMIKWDLSSASQLVLYGPTQILDAAWENRRDRHGRHSVTVSEVHTPSY